MSTSRTYEERRRDAAETFGRFFPETDPDQTAVGLGRRLGALGSMAFEVVGEMWARPQLSRRDRSLLVISTLAVQAREDELTLHARIGLRHGLKREEIEEVLPLVAAYAGFPAAMAASRRIDAGLLAELGGERLSDRTPSKPKADAERDRDASGVRARLIGREGLTPEAGLAEMEERLGDVGVTAYRWAFGEIWSRAELAPRDRSIAVIAMLVALGQPAQLAFHAPAGLRNGLTRIEIEEIVHHLALYAGIPRTVDAIGAVRAAWARLDASPRADA